MSDSINKAQIRELDLQILDEVICLLRWISVDHAIRNETAVAAKSRAVRLEDLFSQRIEIIEERY